MSLKTICFDPPIPNALVAFVDPNTGEVVGGGLTDSEGKVTLVLREGTYKLIVAKKDFHVYEGTVTITEDMSINIALSEIATPLIETASAKTIKASISEEIPSTALGEFASTEIIKASISEEVSSTALSETASVTVS